ELTDRVCETLGARAKSTTADEPLPGARDGAGEDAPGHLRDVYGARAARVLALAREDPSLATPLCPHHRGLAAEVVHAVRAEWARTLGDVLLRRTMLGIAACQGLDCVEQIAERVGALLGWDAARRQDEIARYRAEIAPMRRFSTA